MSSTVSYPLDDEWLPRHVEAPEAGLGFLLDGVEQEQFACNARAAIRARRIVEAIHVARAHPEIYLPPADPQRRERPDFIDRCVLHDLSLRLRVSEAQLRQLAFVAETAMQHLPQLWQRALEGFAPWTLVESTAAAVARLAPPPDASPEETDASDLAILTLDERTSEWVLGCTPAQFRRRLHTLLEHLDARRADIRHAAAMRDRRVFVEHLDHGMSCVSAIVPTMDALAISRRLTSSAKHLQKDKRDGRTRDMIRADLYAQWLRGVGTATAVKTKIFVTVPVTLLAAPGDLRVSPEAAPDSDTAAITGSRASFPDLPMLVGHGPIDPLTAKQLFLEAKAFRRVITDPVRGVVLDIDRRTYRPTRAQRDWLILHHGTCARDGCSRLALEADLDHRHAWGSGGKTNVANLDPLCPADHVLKHDSRFTYRRRANATIQVTTPTGHVTEEPPPF